MNREFHDTRNSLVARAAEDGEVRSLAARMKQAHVRTAERLPVNLTSRSGRTNPEEIGAQCGSCVGRDGGGYIGSVSLVVRVLLVTVTAIEWFVLYLCSLAVTSAL